MYRVARQFLRGGARLREVPSTIPQSTNMVVWACSKTTKYSVVNKSLLCSKQKFAYSRNFYYLCTIFVKNLQMNEILLAILAIGIAILLLSLGVILRKDHKFRSEHISQNQRMRQDGIHCATSQDREARKKEKMNIEDWKWETSLTYS